MVGNRDRLYVLDNLAVYRQVLVRIRVEGYPNRMGPRRRFRDVEPTPIYASDLFPVEIKVGMAFACNMLGARVLRGKTKVFCDNLQVPARHAIFMDDQVDLRNRAIPGEVEPSMVMWAMRGVLEMHLGKLLTGILHGHIPPLVAEQMAREKGSDRDQYRHRSFPIAHASALRIRGRADRLYPFLAVGQLEECPGAEAAEEQPEDHIDQCRTPDECIRQGRWGRATVYFRLGGTK